MRIEKYAAICIAKLPRALTTKLAKPRCVDGQTLDSQLQIVLAVNNLKGGFETLGGVEQARARYRHIAKILEAIGPAPGSIEDQEIATDNGAVPIRVYQPDVDGPRPCIVFFHGGGYTIGDLETHDGLCRRFCLEVGATVVSVDYRLSPEHPFPAGIQDCAAVTRWVLASADLLGIDAGRVAVAGDSAGGTYAAVVSQEVPGLAFQLLIYPGTEARFRTRSRELFGEGYGLDNTTADWFFEYYSAGASMDHPRISPAASKTLSASPPTHIATAGFDILRDEGHDYAALLREAGVSCSLENHSSVGHGFVHITRIPACDEATASLVDALRKGLQ